MEIISTLLEDIVGLLGWLYTQKVTELFWEEWKHVNFKPYITFCQKSGYLCTLAI